ncbi:MAG TPA: PKD domain-containing protein, partial [Solirubrobacterales bacterium]|nr:PKD domain-containing protein [Solirubrobacterales bacterium]
MAAALAVVAFLVAAQPAAAKGGGQIGSGWGTPGSANGQFFNPAMLGVDPVDGSVYTGDLAGTTSEGETAKYRIQKFTAAGSFQAAAEIPRFPATGKLASLQGIAVDHGLGRIYAIEGCRVAAAGGSLSCLGFGGKVGARKILVYSTTPEGSALKALSPIELPAGAEEIYEPQAIAVDPASHDIVVLGNENAKHRIVQRISSAGVLGARYTDTADVLKPASGGAANSLAVSPTGVVYTMTGGGTPPSLFTKLYKLPAGLGSLEALASVPAAAGSEEWLNGWESSVEAFYGGPQLAISEDGDTLYWKEQIKRSEEAEAGELTVRAFSLGKGQTVGLWGGGSSSCKITTNSAGLAATTGGNLVVFDFGQATKKSTDTPAYGRKVYTFGPSGSGCKEAVAKFSVAGKSEAETPTGLKPGEAIAFNASASELAGGARKEMVWKWGDGTETVLAAPSESEEAPATANHTYTAAGTYTVKLQIKLKVPLFDNPDVRERTITVGTAAPQFTLKVKKSGNGQGTLTSNPAGINCGSACEAEYSEGTEVTLTPSPAMGSEFTGWSGACTGTGTCKVTMSQLREVSAGFALEKRLLKVTKTGSGQVTSSPSGINCAVTCEALFDYGAEVTLSASAEEGST